MSAYSNSSSQGTKKQQQQRSVLFVPRHRRQRRNQQQERFHGAFTGGFSAGYFNTVGSSEGWKPKNIDNDDGGRRESARHPKQKMEDFMDEQDFNEWGGPHQVQKQYRIKGVATTRNDVHGDPAHHIHDESKLSSSSLMKDLRTSLTTSATKEAQPLQRPIGIQLLRAQGYREGTSQAYFYEHNEVGTGDNTLFNSIGKSLRRKRLRSSIQQVLPPSKRDTAGLGFDVYRDAPEFQRLKERRQQDQRKRREQSVYRLSDMMNATEKQVRGRDKGIDVLKTKPETRKERVDGQYLVSEIVERKGVAGFCLRDDEDDVYDHQANSKIDDGFADEYSNEIQDIDDEDDDMNMLDRRGGQQGLKKKVTSVLFSAWTTTETELGGNAKCSGQQPARKQLVGSDGKPALDGFVLGGTGTNRLSDVKSHQQRFRGPDVPPNWRPLPHIFHEEDRKVLRDLEHRLSKHWQPERRPQLRAPLINPTAEGSSESTKGPMAGNRFQGLTLAMKNRFTSGGTGIKSHELGLTKKKRNTEEIVSVDERREQIQVKRQTHLFYPTRLVCTRFQIKNLPSHVRNSSSSLSSSTVKAGDSEVAFFETVLDQQKLNSAEQEGRTSSSREETIMKSSYALLQELATKERTPPVDSSESHPSMDMKKSIYEAHSDGDDDDGVNDDEPHPILDRSDALKQNVISTTQCSGVVTTQESPTASSNQSMRFIGQKVDSSGAETQQEGTDAELKRKGIRSYRNSAVSFRPSQCRLNGDSDSTDLDASSSSEEEEDRRLRRKRKKDRRRKERRKEKSKKAKKSKKWCRKG